MLMTIEAAALAGLLKKAGSLGADLVELSAAKGDQVTLRGGRMDRARQLPDSHFLLELVAAAPARHVSPGSVVLGLKSLQTTAGRLKGQVLLAKRGRRLEVRGRLSHGNRLALSYPLLEEGLPKAPKITKGHPEASFDEGELMVAVNNVSPVLPSGAAAANDRLSDIVVELVAAGSGDERSIVQVGATNGTTLLAAHLKAGVKNLALSQPKRLPAEAVNALGQLGGGDVSIAWGNQVVVKGTEAVLVVPLRAADAHSLVQITLRAKPGHGSGLVHLDPLILSEALDALKGAAADASAKVQLISKGAAHIGLILEGSSHAEGETDLPAQVTTAIDVRLSLEALRQAMVASQGQRISLGYGGPQRIVSVNARVEALGADGPVAILAPYMHASIPAAAPAAEAPVQAAP